jgi:flagellar biosynthesis protein FlhA
MGYTVVDAATVVATHLSQLLTNHAAQLLGHEEVQNLLDLLAKSHPKLVEGLVPEILPLGVVVKVLQGLLNEGVPIRDIRTIVQTLSDYGVKSQDAEILTAACRIALKRMISQNIVGAEPEIPVITLSPELEQILHNSIQAGGSDGAGIEPGLAERIQRALFEASQQQELAGQPAVLLTSGVLRTTLAKFVKNTIPGLQVLSYQEVPEDKQIRIVNSVGQ